MGTAYETWSSIRAQSCPRQAQGLGLGEGSSWASTVRAVRGGCRGLSSRNHQACCHLPWTPSGASPSTEAEP